MRPDGNDNNEKLGVAIDIDGTFDLERLSQIDQRQQLVAPPEHRRLMDRFDPVLAIARGPHQLHDADLRHGETFGAGLDNERRDDGQGKRNLDRKRQSLALDRFYLDRAANFLDVGAHDIHPDAAARNIGALGGGRKTSVENKGLNLLVRHRRELRFGRQTVLKYFLANLRHTDSAAVVADLDDDLATFVESAKANDTGIEFPGLDTFFGHFQTVIGGIADHVGQRILDHFQDLTIKFGFRTGHLQVDLLFQFVREVTDDTRKLGPRIADRLHSRLHDVFLQLGGNVVQSLQRRGKFAVLYMANHLEQLIARQHQFADRRH